MTNKERDNQAKKNKETRQTNIQTILQEKEIK